LTTGLGLSTHLANRREQQINAVAIGGAELLGEPAGLIAHAVEYAVAVLDAAELALDFVGCAGDEQLLEHARGARFARYADAFAIPRQVVGPKAQAGVARFGRQLRGDFLVERNRIAQITRPHAFAADAGEQARHSAVTG
jgi:hypothetical protein